MTTTSAARVQSTYNTLRSQIVIVEEAAEVLESHIVTSLSPSCKHLILIGDHQQLRPSTADYYIETVYVGCLLSSILKLLQHSCYNKTNLPAFLIFNSSLTF